MKLNQPIKEPRPHEEGKIREEIDAWVVVINPAGGSKILHIPDGEGTVPRCDRNYNGNSGVGARETKLVRKDVAAFPQGWTDLCKYCVQLWRES